MKRFNFLAARTGAPATWDYFSLPLEDCRVATRFARSSVPDRMTVKMPKSKFFPHRKAGIRQKKADYVYFFVVYVEKTVNGGYVFGWHFAEESYSSFK